VRLWGKDVFVDVETGVNTRAANERRRHQTDERSEEGWWRRRESFFRVLLSHRKLREILKRQKRQTV
jgi:hypothetical protein